MRVPYSAVITLLIGSAALVSSDAVVSLTKDNFKTVVTEDKLVMVKFFAPWCGHCKAMAEDYKSAAETLEKESKIVIAEVDCTEERDLCQEYDVSGYPTVKVFSQGKPADYQGARKADAIVGYLRKRTLPALSKVEHEKLAEFVKSDKFVVVGFYDDDVEDHKDEHALFSELAKELSEEILFGYAEDPKSAEEYGVKAPAFVVFKQFDEPKVVFDGKFEKEEFKAFITAQKTPLLDEIGPENFMSYVEAGLPLAYLFLDEDEDRKPLQEMLKPIAKKHKGKVNFVWIDATKYSGHASNLNLEEKWPAFAIQDPKAQTKFPFDQDKKITAEELGSFLDDFVAGKISPSVKSEPIPEKNDEPVKIIVAHQYEELVMDKKKDVFVEFYAPWCGHCKKMAPVFDDLAKRYQPHADKITIAKMDSTANDLPASAGFSISGFPTLKLIKAETNEVVDYEGDRSLEDMFKFIQENAHHKVEIKEEEKKAEEGEKKAEEEGEKKEEEGEDKKAHEEL